MHLIFPDTFEEGKNVRHLFGRWHFSKETRKVKELVPSQRAKDSVGKKGSSLRKYHLSSQNIETKLGSQKKMMSRRRLK